jgi:hypothetical protein
MKEIIKINESEKGLVTQLKIQKSFDFICKIFRTTIFFSKYQKTQHNDRNTSVYLRFP